MRTTLVCLAVCILFCANLWSQSQYRLGLLPTINVSHKFGADNIWRINAKQESRILFSQRSPDGLSDRSGRYLLTDLSLAISYRVGVNSSIAIGYLERIREGKNLHRAMQQYSIVRKREFGRYAHRIATDQTWGGEDSDLVLRGRYRFSADFPLAGYKVDPKEFYFKPSLEFLWVLEDASTDLEIRCVPTLGFLINESNKLEISSDYRLDSLLSESVRHTLWSKVAWYHSLPSR